MTSDEVQVWSEEDQEQARKAGWWIVIYGPFGDDNTWILSTIPLGMLNMASVVQARADAGCELSKRGIDEATRRHAIWRLTK